VVNDFYTELLFIKFTYLFTFTALIYRQIHLNLPILKNRRLRGDMIEFV